MCKCGNRCNHYLVQVVDSFEVRRGVSIAYSYVSLVVNYHHSEIGALFLNEPLFLMRGMQTLRNFAPGVFITVRAPRPEPHQDALLTSLSLLMIERCHATLCLRDKARLCTPSLRLPQLASATSLGSSVVTRPCFLEAAMQSVEGP